MRQGAPQRVVAPRARAFLLSALLSTRPHAHGRVGRGDKNDAASLQPLAQRVTWAGGRTQGAAAWRVVAHTRATRQQKVQHPMGAACAAAPRSLQILARAGSLKTSSGRSLKILGQNASSWRWRERAPVAPHFLQCTDPRRAALGFAFPRARAPQAASPRSTTSSGASSFELLSEVRREARQWGGARGQAARGGAHAAHYDQHSREAGGAARTKHAPEWGGV